MPTPTYNSFIQDLFSQQSLIMIILFVVVSSPEAYRLTESVIGRHGLVNIAIHGLVLIALYQYVAPYFDNTDLPQIGRSVSTNSRI